MSGKRKHSVKPGECYLHCVKEHCFMRRTLSRGLVPTVCDHCFLASPVNSLDYPAELQLFLLQSRSPALLPSSCLCVRKVAASPCLGFPFWSNEFFAGLRIQWCRALPTAGAVAAGFGTVPCARLFARAWDRPGARTRTTSISHMSHKAASSSAACKASWVFLPLPLSPCHGTFFSVVRQQVSQNSPFCL